MTAADLQARYRAAMASLSADQQWAVDHALKARCLAACTDEGFELRLERALDREANPKRPPDLVVGAIRLVPQLRAAG